MFTEGVLLLERVADEVDLDTRPRRPSSRTRSRRSRTPSDRSRRGWRRPSPRRWRQVFAAHPLRDLLTTEGPYPFFVDRQRALFSSWYEFFPRSEGAYVDEKTGKVVSGTLRTAAKRLDGRRRDGLRRDLPAADPPDRRGEPQGRQQHPHPDPRRRRLALGDRQQGRRPRRHPPRPRHPRGLRRLRGRGRDGSGLEVALDFALQAAPDHPWATEHPEWFTTRADGTIAYAENPPKKYQDIYPINFDNDPEGIYAESRAAAPALDVPRRADLPRRQPAHQAGRVLGVAARPDPRDRPRRALPLRGVHQAADDAGARRRSASTRATPTSPGATAATELETYLHEVSHETSPRAAAELLRQHPRHPARVPPVRRPAGVQDPRRRRRDRLAELGRVRRLRALRAHGGASRAARSTSTRRSSRSGSATGTPPSAAGRRWRRTSPGSTRSAARTPRCSSCATSPSTRSDDDAVLVFSKHVSTARPAATTSSSWWSTSTRTPRAPRWCT